MTFSGGVVKQEGHWGRHTGCSQGQKQAEAKRSPSVACPRRGWGAALWKAPATTGPLLPGLAPRICRERQRGHFWAHPLPPSKDKRTHATGSW